MKILVTGGAGFIGSYLSESLLEMGHEVYVIDDLSTGRMENISHFLGNSRFHMIRDTILNKMIMDRLVSQTDMIFHLAAAVGVNLIIEKPVEVIETNIIGTEVVLSTAYRYLSKVLLSSTSEIYGKSEDIPFNEEHDRLLGPVTKTRWCYSSSKAVDEYLALSYYKEKELPVTIVRLFNTVGPRQQGQYGMVIPRFVQQALKEDPITVFGDGEQIRTFVYVSDAVEALIKLAFNEEAIGEIYNLGTDKQVTINELASKVKDITNSPSKIIHIPYDEAYEKGFEDMRIRIPDIQKIKELIGFEPSTSLDEIIESVANYYRD